MDVEQLEKQFDEIDKQSDVDTIGVSLDPSSNLSVNLVRTVTSISAPPGSVPGEEGVSDTYTETTTEKLLEVNVKDIDISDDYIHEKVLAGIANDNTGEGLPGVKLVQIGASQIYEVVEDYSYSSQEYTITALKGFAYDRSSIPRIFWVIISKDDLSNVPPLFHDLLYSLGGVLPANQISPYRTFQRKDVDDLFLELMRKCGVKHWRARLAYQAVRNFAGFAWKG